MAYESIKIRETVDRAVSHQWSIPEFQRGFVWKPTQVRDLIESLWYDYPVGSLLVWNSQQQPIERVAHDAQRPGLWVVDGQQRTTALCILHGRKPYWWPSSDEWNKTLKRYDIRFDIHAKEPPFFLVANAAIQRAKGNRYIPVSRLLVLDTNREEDQKNLTALAKEIKLQGFCDGMDAMEVYTRLDRVRKIREKEIVTITIDHELEQVVEIFSRLNSKGTRVTEADIYLGVVAARNPGWVRDTFIPHLDVLAQAGFDLNPNLLFRCVSAVGCNKVRFREIPDDFWGATSIKPAWEKTRDAWQRLIGRFREYGVLSNEPLPTETALVTMIRLVDRFHDPENFDAAMYWFIQASRFARYSGSSFTALEEDLRDVSESNSLPEAVDRLLKRFEHKHPIIADDFLRDYTDGKFWRFLLYLLIYQNGALDWDEHGHRIGFEGLEALADFTPQWHHVYPKKFLEGQVNDGLVDALANIAVIGPTINIRINSKDPMRYVETYKISADKLAQQYIDPTFATSGISGFGDWLNKRAGRLADESNLFLAKLRDSQS